MVNVQNSHQEIVALTGKGSHISALALNPTRNLIAFTEYGDRPLLVVYDLEARKKLKLLRCAEFKSHDVVSLAFSHDSKYILVQGGHDDHRQRGVEQVVAAHKYCIEYALQETGFRLIVLVLPSSKCDLVRRRGFQ